MTKKKNNIQEAHRVIKNLYANFEALGELKVALEFTEDADKFYREAEIKLQESKEKLDARQFDLAELEREFSSLDDTFKNKHKELTVQLNTEIDVVKSKRLKEERSFEDFLENNQSKINSIKSKTKEMQNRFELQEKNIQSRIADLIKARDQQEKALIDSKKRLQAVIGGISNG